MKLKSKPLATTTTAFPPLRKRIHFIDALRAYAILMMLQGHFVDTLLAPVYRDEGHLLFGAWKFMRGMTAPIFFTVTGLIFVFLLLKAEKPGEPNLRVRRGIRRAFFLIGVGYLLRLFLPGLFVLQINAYFWGVDVLHCIGLALLALIGAYVLAEKTGLPLPSLLAVFGLTAFGLHYRLSGVDWTFLPMPLENYFTGGYHSTFTPIPWVGYTMLGGIAGWHLHARPRWYSRPLSPLLFVAAGLWLHFFSSKTWWNLYELSGIDLFHDLAYNNFLFMRLGHVLLVLAVFIWLDQLVRFPALFLKIGRETLTVYGVHYVLLYGTWFGFGIYQWLGQTLGPWQCLFGASAFLLFFALLIDRIEQVRETLYVTAPAFLKVQWRWWRVRTIRAHLRRRYRRRLPVGAEEG